MSGSGDTLALRPADAGDWPLLQQWARRPDIQAWWGPQAAIEAEIAIAMADPTALARMIVAGEDTIGYAQASDAGRMDGATAVDGIAAGTWRLEIVIASRAHRGRGLGSAAARALADEVLATTLAVGVCLLVPIGNEAAVRAYEKRGFHWTRIVTDPVRGRCWLMQAGRGALEPVPGGRPR